MALGMGRGGCRGEDGILIAATALILFSPRRTVSLSLSTLPAMGAPSLSRLFPQVPLVSEWWGQAGSPIGAGSPACHTTLALQCLCVPKGGQGGLECA